MEQHETTLQHHNRMLLEDREREKYRDAAEQGFGFLGAMTDGWGAVLHAFKHRPRLSLLLGAVLIGIASLMLTGSVMIAVGLIALAGVWRAVSAYRKRRAIRGPSFHKNARS